MSVSIDTSDAILGLMGWMQDESTVLPSGGEIYKNLRWPEGHELPSFINSRFRAYQEPTSMRSSCDFRQCRRTRTYLMNRFGKGTASAVPPRENKEEGFSP
jgi:hypothetical protein